jgi:hypothetical protein
MKKFESVVRSLSFGEQYLVASLVYLGLSLILIASMPEMKVAVASEGGCTHQVPVYDEGVIVGYTTVSGCPDGQSCCGGTCIGEGQGCCNGTSSYNTSTQGCCNGHVYAKETQKCCGCGVRSIDDCCCDQP